jgi:hypothetical protein
VQYRVFIGEGEAYDSPQRGEEGDSMGEGEACDSL